MRALIAAVLLASISTLALAEPPARPSPSFGSAKRVSRDVIYADQRTTFYCGCAFTPTNIASGGAIDATECGYKPRK